MTTTTIGSSRSAGAYETGEVLMKCFVSGKIEDKAALDSCCTYESFKPLNPAMSSRSIHLEKTELASDARRCDRAWKFQGFRFERGISQINNEPFEQCGRGAPCQAYLCHVYDLIRTRIASSITPQDSSGACASCCPGAGDADIINDEGHSALVGGK